MDIGGIIMIFVIGGIIYMFYASIRDRHNGTTARKHGKKCPKCGTYMNPEGSFYLSVGKGPYERKTNYKCPNCKYKTFY